MFKNLLLIFRYIDTEEMMTKTNGVKVIKVREIFCLYRIGNCLKRSSYCLERENRSRNESDEKKTTYIELLMSICKRDCIAFLKMHHLKYNISFKLIFI